MADRNSDVQSLQSVNENLQFLHAISQKISEKKPLPELMHEIMESSKELMGAEASSLLLYDEKDGKLHFQVATGEKGKLMETFTVEMGTGIAGWVAEHRESLLIEDCYQDPRFDSAYDKKSSFRTRSMICVPLMRHQKLIGVIQVINKKEGGVFNEDDLFIFHTLASQCAIAIENYQLTENQITAETLARELATAREIQQNLLPTGLPEFDDLDVAAVILPAKEVGGDYYNILRLNDLQSLFFVSDVSGKSISAALIVSILDACLHAFLKLHMDQFDLMKLVVMMNQVLIESTTSTKFATSWFGLFHHPTSELISINAGHNPPYLFRAGNDEAISLEAGGIFLGSYDLAYQTEKVTLQSGDLLLVYTDGVTEAWDHDEEEYGDARLIQTTLTHRDLPAQAIMDAIQNDVELHVSGAPQSDDFTCLLIKK
ncbi:SpoIIE family protein phosphatase [candidate division KSB1 bacterium]|nr:SpoIIE family protein phosphatase [candidate division KSB1 bacterium]